MTETDASGTKVALSNAIRRRPVPGAGIVIGYARCSTEKQDLTAQREILRDLGVAEERVYLDHGLTGTNRSRPGLNSALAAMREGDTLVVPKLDRLARSVPDARAIGDSLAARGVSAVARRLCL
jgi:DNA invertase Pin-like site-specific DNA recombinase